MSQCRSSSKSWEGEGNLAVVGGVKYDKTADTRVPLVTVDGLETALLDELVKVETADNEGRTREDYGEISDQNYDACSKTQEVGDLAGSADTIDIDLKYMDAGDMFEKEFLTQYMDENGSLDELPSLLWNAVSSLPRTKLAKVKDRHVEKFYQGNDD